MADIKITFAEVKGKATQIRKCNDNLTEYLNEIKSKITSLDAQWTSDASDTIRGKISGMQAKFDDYHTIIESYAAFLDTTVSNYEQTEQVINSNASQFE